MSTIMKQDFGTTHDGRAVALYHIRNSRGTTLSVCTYGGAVQSLKTKAKNGAFVDVVLGYGDAGTYEKEDKFIGALIGRCGNRIAKGRFSLNGKDYQLECNDGANHLHGGTWTGFHKKLWQGEITKDGLKLTYTSPDGEGGYPGTMEVTVWYDVTESNAVTIRYQAVCDADTVCNLTNHTYFNLNGYDSGTILNHTIQLFADAYTESDAESLPDGKIIPVDGTPMDLRQPTPIGAHIDDDFDQLNWGHGYDHNWVIRWAPCNPPVADWTGKGLSKMAQAVGDTTGITLTAYTSQPGVQFYTGNYLDGKPLGKDGVPFLRRQGFCLEAQYFPNAMAHPSFDQPILRKGDIWKAETVYQFGTTEE
ncbi:MAG: galactose mutarotase [Megasphaera sp.]|nr:galactose mutarotase [Megasphaera sp.]MCH4187801.1 galactose mutarotase [Megasphaera sp.]MCH4218026.1 galactose mutarotase [Megasphaera sp.]